MPDKVLLVCSSTAANIQKVREILHHRTLFNGSEFHLLCSSSDLPYLQKEPTARQVWVFPHLRNLRDGFRLWLRIRGQRYRTVVVLWCGDEGRLRPKLFALVCGGNRILIFDKCLEGCPLNTSFLVRLLADCARQRCWNAGPVGRLLLVCLISVLRFLVRALLIPIRFLILVLAILILYAGGRFSWEGAKSSGKP